MRRRRLPAVARFAALATDGFLVVERGDWVTADRIMTALRLDPLYLYVRIKRELPPGQARVVRTLLDDSDEVPASYRWVAAGHAAADRRTQTILALVVDDPV